MRSAASYRGQPLVAFLLLLGGWVAVRAMVWNGGSGVKMPLEPIAPLLQAEAQVPAAAPVADTASVEAASRPAPPPPPSAWPEAPFAPHPARLAPPPAPRWPSAPLPPAASQVPQPSVRTAPVPAHVTAGHQLLWMAALSNLPLPRGVIARPAAFLSPAAPASPASSAPAQPAPRGDRRWSADAWLLLRQGGSVPSAGGLAPATYGASQAGAVVRYRLAPTSQHRPTLYLRGSAALNGSREHEAALGASARPIAGLPVAAAIEGRVNRQPSGTRVRPAAFAYTELPPVALPGGSRGELYAQAGYVGGNFASAFVDGQLRVDRRVLQLGRGELRAGGGVWGGAQKGASRLDLGPAATVNMPLGESAGARLGVDWRFRVAGDAAPSSGPALTLSAGF